jgi:hypothetical protein
MIGVDLPSLDPFILSLLSNEEVLAVDQKSSGNRELFARGDHIAWSAEVPGTRERYLAVFNLADDSPAEIPVSWNELGLNSKCAVRNLWERKELGVFDNKFVPTVRQHSAGLYRLRPAKS